MQTSAEFNRVFRRYSKPLSTAASVLLVGIDFAIVAAAVVLSELLQHALAYCAAALVIGSRMRAAHNLIHECVHRRLGTPRTNSIIAYVLAPPTLVSPSSFRASHILHHRKLGLEDDPDLVRYEKLGATKLPIAMTWHRCLAGVPSTYFRYLIWTFWGFTAFKRDRDLLFLVAAWCGVLWLSFEFAFYSLLLKYWFVPFLTTFQLIKFVTELGEHGGLYDVGAKAVPASYRARAVLMSRTVNLGRVLNWFFYPHGDGFHMLHHYCPAVPGPRLARVHAELTALGWKEQHETANSYIDNFLFPARCGNLTLFSSLVKVQPR